MITKVSQQFLSPAELSARWGIPTETLRSWRKQGRGPGFVKLGHAIRYPLSQVETYEAEHLRTST